MTETNLEYDSLYFGPTGHVLQRGGRCEPTRAGGTLCPGHLVRRHSSQQQERRQYRQPHPYDFAMALMLNTYF
jgi:hypothetical protein